MTVSAQYAVDHIADLLAKASRGEEIEIALPDQPSLKITLLSPSKESSQGARRVLGAGRGEMRVPSQQEWHEMDLQLERQMNRAELMVSDEG